MLFESVIYRSMKKVDTHTLVSVYFLFTYVLIF